MKSGLFEHELAEIVSQLPAGPRVAIVGGTSFWHGDSEATCKALGRLLANIDGLVLLTGGVGGVGEAVGRSFYNARAESGGHRGAVHVLPRGCERWDYGQTLFAGADLAERREVLGRLAEIYVAVEGGPGTAHELNIALARSVLVIPIGRSGGCTGELYAQVPGLPGIDEAAWRVLGDIDSSPEQVAETVQRIIELQLQVSWVRNSLIKYGEIAPGQGTKCRQAEAWRAFVTLDWRDSRNI